jgi:hypothetical protein
MTEEFIMMNNYSLFAGDKSISIFQLKVLEQALYAWGHHKLRFGRAYTPKSMMQLAAQMTGKQFKPRDYLGAAEACGKRCEELRAEVKTEMIINRTVE